MSLAVERMRVQIGAGVLMGSCATLIAVGPGLAQKAAVCAVLVAIPLCWWMLREPSRWLAAFFVSALLLPPLPIALGDAGPHVALLFAGFGLLIGMIHPFRVSVNLLSLSFGALFTAIAASVAMAAIYSGLGIAAGSLARVILLGISVYVFFFVRGSSVSFDMVRVLFWAGVGSAVFACLDFYFQFPAPGGYGPQFIWLGSAVFACLDFYFQFPAPGGYGPQFIWLESGVFRRAQGVFYEASTLGNICAFFLEMIAVALFRPRAERPVSMAAMLGGGAALALALVLSYSRASLVNLVVALLVLAWLNRGRLRLRRVVIAAGTLGGAAFAILSGLLPVFAHAYWLRISQSFSYLLESPNAILSGRIHSWTILMQFLLEHPWHALFGIGYKTLPYSDFIGQTAIADNTYLSILIETGIAGLGALVVWNLAIVRESYRAARSGDAQKSFCGTWMLCFWTGQMVQMFSADLLTYWRVLPVYMCVLALAVRRR